MYLMLLSVGLVAPGYVYVILSIFITLEDDAEVERVRTEAQERRG